MPAHPVDLEQALARLAAGGVVAIPTETVYGLAADAADEAALRAIFATKGRPMSNPLIVHLPDTAAVDDWAAALDDPTRALLAAFWPGPLTVVLPAREQVSRRVTAGGDSVALRVPAHPLARELLRRFGRALCAPSANRSGYVSPTTAAHVLADYPDHDVAVLDGGTCPAGIESTIVRPLDGVLQVLRPGAVPLAALRSAWPGPVEVVARSEVAVPGSAPRHYAPATPVAEAGREALQAAGPTSGVIARGAEPATAGAVVRLLPDEPEAFASALYATLRELDGLGLERILVESLPDGEDWTALRNRLARAAHPG